MKKEQQPYGRVKDAIKTGELQNLPLGIKLKNGAELTNITPYTIVEGLMGEQGSQRRTLRLFYLDKNRKFGTIDVNDVQGLNVVEGTGDFAGKLMIEFTYFKGTHDDDFREDNSRIVYATDINFGIHAFHHDIGEEKRDFYIVGEDSQYSADRSRQFPLWRVDAYGNAADLVEKFKSSK